ncbi:uncharacterized protein LOC131597596 [Vicia villosa]|uniref:uncharacterized protein LOC131597596 n=1 Tax=Vicia villosa TaxID=3911 RepID=UPI00273CE72B|nr:uncharacterized protein LOC131597596 [Vicia villosa]
MSSLPWCTIGDFNDMLSQQDKHGIHPHPNWLCNGFRDTISDCNLVDIPLEGHQYTWVKSRGTDRMVEERLDRALANTSWLEMFPAAKLANLIASHSDHSPILLSCDPALQHRRHHAFRFENYWLEEDDIEDVVRQGWQQERSCDVTKQIANYAKDLEKWNNRNRRRKKEEIDRHKSIMESYRNSHDSEANFRFLEAQREYDKALIKEDLYWRQRAKMHWYRDGDRNTHFFHQSATARRNFKQIRMLKNEEGNEVAEHADLSNVARSYFESLFTKTVGNYDGILNLFQQVISGEDNEKLVRPIK